MTARTDKPGRSRRRTLLRILLGVLFALTLGIAVYAGDYYRADETALACLEEPLPGVEVERQGSRMVFKPRQARAGLIFYPGGKVEYTAYAPLMVKLAEEGILCVLVKMPLNLAVLNPSAAAGIREAFPDVEVWAIGGHSLGGVMAARYAAEHPQEFNALVLLASYAASDIRQSGTRVLSVYGTHDGVLKWDQYEKCRGNLPADLTEQAIEGGCHAGFGSYGPQKGDGMPGISAVEQQEEAAALIVQFLLPKP